MEASPENKFWYLSKIGEPVHEKVVALGRSLLAIYRPAHNKDRAAVRMYEQPIDRAYQRAVASLSARGITAAKLNVAKAVVDTVTARHIKRRAMPSFVVDDASWTLKRKAQRYRKFLIGKMMETEFDARSRECLRDGNIIGTGITTIDENEVCDDVFAERTFRYEILFDPRESQYGKPRNRIRVRRYARDHLAALYPEFKEEIKRAANSERRTGELEDQDFGQSLDLADYVDVYEAHHLPITDESKDGRHALCIDGATLCSEGWEYPRFPSAMYRYAKPHEGVWGRSLIHEVADIQHRINETVRDVQMNLVAAGRGMMMQRKGSDVPVERLTGIAPFNVTYSGNSAPQWNAPQPVNVVQIQLLEFFIRQAFEISGVSQAFASSKNTVGLNASGVAKDVQYETESERMADSEANYADYRMEAAQLYLDAAERVAKRRDKKKGEKRSYSYTSTWRSQDAIERLEYKDVRLGKEEYRLQLEPVNFIPETRAGKLSMVAELSKGGIIPQWLVATLFDEPDIKAANKLSLAPFNNALRKMEEIMEPSKPLPMPEPYNDLDLEMTIATAFYNWAQHEKADEDTQDRFRQYIDAVEALLAKKKQGMAPPADPMAAAPPGIAPPMAGPPMGDPMAPPMDPAGLPPGVLPS